MSVRQLPCGAWDDPHLNQVTVCDDCGTTENETHFEGRTDVCPACATTRRDEREESRC